MGHHSVCSESDYILGLRRKGEWSEKAIMIINDKYDNDNEYVIWILAMMIRVLVKHTEFNVTNITVSPLPQTATSDSPQPLCPLPSIFSTILLNTLLLLPLYSNEWCNHWIIHFRCWLSFCRSAPSLWWTPICTAYPTIAPIPRSKRTIYTHRYNPYTVFPVCSEWK